MNGSRLYNMHISEGILSKLLEEGERTRVAIGCIVRRIVTEHFKVESDEGHTRPFVVLQEPRTTFRLGPKTVKALEAEAKSRRIGAAALVRLILVERYKLRMDVLAGKHKRRSR